MITAALILVACRGRSDAAPPLANAACVAPPVPAQEADIYHQQQTWLAAYRATVDAHSPGARSQPVFGGHLLTADSNRADALLQPDAMRWVELSLDRFRQMGMRGVTLNLGYPLLMPWFPDSDRYLLYYKNVAKAVRERGMRLGVEQIVLYTRSPFSPFTFALDDLTLEKYTADQAQMAQIIVDELAPDDLTVLHEPDTIAELTGLRAMLTPSVATAYVNSVLAPLHREHTAIGAGSGSWSGAAFAEAFAKDTAVDYIDIHIYWINPASIANAYAMATAAERARKPVVITEAGLYKSLGAGREGTPHVDGVAAVYRRDVFSFWEPLDMQFLETTARFARSVDTRYISAYWTNMFFSYIDWTPETAPLPYSQLNAQRSGQLTAQAWVNGALTCAGRAYERVIEDRR